MKRSSFKYIFYLNVLLLYIVGVFALNISNFKNEEYHIPSSVTTSLVTDSNSPDLAPSAKAAVLIDAKSGAVLYEKNSSERLPMASTTKIMTAIAVIENSSANDVITITKESAGIEGSSIYLKEGEKLTVNDLLYGLILESGNDAAHALAVGIFGSEKACVDKMNSIAKSKGLAFTHFENVHGLDSENHYTTAYELSLIMKYAMENEYFRTISSSRNYVTKSENKRYFSNHNKLLKKCPYITGGKTGYTSKSGRCLVTSSCFDGKEYIAVTLSDRNDWQDHENMHTFANENFFSVEIANEKDFFVYRGFQKYIPAETVYLTCDRDSDFLLDYKVTFRENRIKTEYSAQDTPLGNFSLISE